jgi:hypothetical protein
LNAEAAGDRREFRSNVSALSSANSVLNHHFRFNQRLSFVFSVTSVVKICDSINTIL